MKEITLKLEFTEFAKKLKADEISQMLECLVSAIKSILNGSALFRIVEIKIDSVIV